MIDKLKEISSTTRVRIILILLVLQFVIVFLSLGAITITSQPSFCNICHEMRADVRAWKSSSHAEVTCYSCHSEGGILAFVLNHMKESREAYYHLTNSFEKPINADGEYGRKMSNKPCKRCHSRNRKVTPRKGIIIDHLKHERKRITCVTCHNRIAHPNMKGYVGEKAEKANVRQVTLKPGVKQAISPSNRPYEDHVRMRFCMVCHTGEEGKGPKECRTCHTPDFDLKPEDHSDVDWLPTPEKLQSVRALHGQEAKARVRDCVSCHKQELCTNCHQVEMPHPATWKQEHGKLGKAEPQECARCHQQPNFCEACHHQFDPTQGPWFNPQPGRSLHPFAVRTRGTADCFNCHNPVYCAHCHVRGTKLP